MGRVPCCDKEDLVKGAWSPDEDRLLVAYIQKHGDGNWAKLPKAAGLRRCGKSCRLRWVNYLRPDLKRESITEEEADLIIDLHRQLGNKWSKIAARLEGRTDNDIKNYWNCHIKRQLIARGINPETHQPLNTVAAATGPATNSGASGLTNASHNNEVDNNIVSRGIHYYNVFLNTKVEITSLKYTKADGEGSSVNAYANGIDLNTTEEAHHPQLNLEFSLAPPFQPEDINNSKVLGEDVKPQEQALCPGNDVDVTLGL